MSKPKPLLTEQDINYLEQRFSQVFITKQEFTQHRSELFNKLDEILKEIVASRQEQTILAHHSADHEDRLTALETAT